MSEPAPVPEVVGRFRIRSRLGDGALLGVDDAGRAAVVRLLAVEAATQPGFRDRFRRDVRRAAGAPPWFAAPVLDADPDADVPWVATARIEGPTLRDYVGHHGPLGAEGTYALATRMLDGLVALHAAGLAHGNLSPATVLLVDDGPRVVDGSLPTVTGPAGAEVPDHLAPEQAAGVSGVTPAVDVFALGGVLLFAATGRSPFGAGTAAETLHRIVHADPDPGPLTGRVREAVAGCLLKDPARRPTAVVLRDYLTGMPDDRAEPAGAVPEPAGPRPGDPAVRRRRFRAAVLAAIVLVLAVAVGSVLAVGGAGRPTAAGAPEGAAPAPAGRAPASVPAGGPGREAAPVPAAPLSGPPQSATPPSGADGDPTAGGDPGDPTAGAVVVDAAADPRFAAGAAAFSAPSHNIVCSMAADQSRCDVAERTWQVPPPPADCARSFGAGAVIARSGAGRLSCGPAAGPPPSAVLDYDTGVRLGDLVCVSRRSGVACRDTATGHGFTVARAGYRLY